MIGWSRKVDKMCSYSCP